MENQIDSTAQKNPVQKKFGWIIVLALFVALVVDAGILFITYKQKLKKAEELDMARPIINTFELPEAQIDKEYTTSIWATVYNFNTKIEGRVVSGLPEGLQLTACQTEFNSPTVTFSKVSSLAKCNLEGIPQKDGRYEVEIFFSIPSSASNPYFSLGVSPGIVTSPNTPPRN